MIWKKCLYLYVIKTLSRWFLQDVFQKRKCVIALKAAEIESWFVWCKYGEKICSQSVFEAIFLNLLRLMQSAESNRDEVSVCMMWEILFMLKKIYFLDVFDVLKLSFLSNDLKFCFASKACDKQDFELRRIWRDALKYCSESNKNRIVNCMM